MPPDNEIRRRAALNLISRARANSRRVELFACSRPCSFCPYRTDVPLRLWAKEEFVLVLEREREELGAVFLCHKENGSVCVGFLMDQVRRDIPSNLTRLDLMIHDVEESYLEGLSSPAPLYASVREMALANYPEILTERPELFEEVADPYAEPGD